MITEDKVYGYWYGEPVTKKNKEQVLKRLMKDLGEIDFNSQNNTLRSSLTSALKILLADEGVL